MTRRIYVKLGNFLQARLAREKNKKKRQGPCAQMKKEKRKIFLLHRVFISSEKLGVWDLCVHLVLNVCLFCFRLVLFVLFPFYFPILLPYFSSLHFSVSCACASCYRLRGVVWIWLALSSLHFPFVLLWLIPPFFLHVR